jgi:hypothetical protein
MCPKAPGLGATKRLGPRGRELMSALQGRFKSARACDGSSARVDMRADPELECRHGACRRLLPTTANPRGTAFIELQS